MQAIVEGHRWMLRLDPGEEMFEQLGSHAREHRIRAAVIVQGIGMLSRATIGYWNGSEYDPLEIAVPHELVGLHGTIAETDGQPSLHLHGTLAGPDHRVVGGHFLRGSVGVLAEVSLDTFPGRVFGRPLDETMGLRKLDLIPGSAPPT